MLEPILLSYDYLLVIITKSNVQLFFGVFVQGDMGGVKGIRLIQFWLLLRDLRSTIKVFCVVIFLAECGFLLA